MIRSGLLGEKLGHSYSPAIHAAFGDYSYPLFEKTAEELPRFFAEAPFDGINVTIPYKKAVVPFMDELSETAAALGSVNTVIKRPDGTLYGDNTDVYGFTETVCVSGLSVSGKKTLVLGSGGASAAVQYALKNLGAQVVVISRTGENNYENLFLHADARFIVNATPVGMFPRNDETPLSLSGFPELEGVFDLVYNPARTMLLQEAASLGIPAFNGLRMLVSQAAKSSESFTGVPVPQDLVETVIRQLSKQMENVVLIGMPGAGKTVIARALAGLTGRPVFDSDEEVTKKTGKTPAMLIEQEGEAAFRTIETEVLQELAKKSGAILSTGGGVVTRPENEAILKRNGKVVWIRRALSELPREGRPLSQGDLKALYAVREPMYRKFADFTVENDGRPEDTAKRIEEQL